MDTVHDTSSDHDAGARLLELVEANAARGRGTYAYPVEPDLWVAGYMHGMMGAELGCGGTLVEACSEALADLAEAA